jgi:hypothetical protein
LFIDPFNVVDVCKASAGIGRHFDFLASSNAALKGFEAKLEGRRRCRPIWTGEVAGNLQLIVHFL